MFWPQIYLSAYSMGAWASVELLQAQPTLFAGALISAGGAGLSVSAIEPLLSNNIITFVGELDAEEVRNNAATTQSSWVSLLRRTRRHRSHGLRCLDRKTRTRLSLQTRQPMEP